MLAWIAINTATDDRVNGWTEVNEIKFLFHLAQGWTRAQAHAFALAARNHVGF